MQLATAIFALTTGAGQVVVVKLLPETGPLGLQLATGTFAVLLVKQVVVTKLLPDDADTGEHVDTPVGPVTATPQVVAT